MAIATKLGKKKNEENKRHTLAFDTRVQRAFVSNTQGEVQTGPAANLLYTAHAGYPTHVGIAPPSFAVLLIFREPTVPSRGLTPPSHFFLTVSLLLLCMCFFFFTYGKQGTGPTGQGGGRASGEGHPAPGGGMDGVGGSVGSGNGKGAGKGGGGGGSGATAAGPGAGGGGGDASSAAALERQFAKPAAPDRGGVSEGLGKGAPSPRQRLRLQQENLELRYVGGLSRGGGGERGCDWIA